MRLRSISSSPIARRAARALASVMLAAMVFAAAGCGGVAGTYRHEEKRPDGETVSMTLELKSGGKAVATMKGGPADSAVMTVEGTYTVDGDKITVEMPGDKDVYTLKDGILTTTAFGETMVFKKQ